MKLMKKKLLAPVVAGSLMATSVVCAFADNTTDTQNTSVPEQTQDEQTDSTGQTPPELPSGEQSDGTGQTPPDLPSGEQPGSSDGNVPDKPDSDGAGGSGMGQPGQISSSGASSYDAVQSVTTDTTIDNQTLTSTGTDENVLNVSENANVTVMNSTVTRTSADSTGGDNSSFYGVGAALLATSGNLYVTNTDIQTDAAGGAGIFAYKDAAAYISDCAIATKQDTSGGIHVAGGGKLYAWNLNVTTQGNSSAAIRSDRGGGTMVVDGGSYTSNGTGSPAIYCTADITVNDADLTANNSEALCIEGLNTTRLFNCNLTGSMEDNSQNDCTWNVILYQSMSGDSQEGNSTFEMVGGTLTAKNGGMFYTTNTESTFVLSNVDIMYADDSEFFLKCTGNSNQRGWGSTGSNGADCNFTAVSQEMQGNVIWDSISNLDFYMTSDSTLSGAFVQDESNAGSGGNGYCNVYISSDSAWTVTGDSTITNLYAQGKIVDADGNTVTIKGTGGTVYVQGTSSYTVTVENYSTTADFSGASTVDSFSDYAVEKPAALTSAEAGSSSTGGTSDSGTTDGSGSTSDGSSTGNASTGSTDNSSSGSASSGTTDTDSADSSSSGSTSSDTSTSDSSLSDVPSTGDTTSPVTVAVSMGTLVIAAGAVYVLYNKKKA